MIHKCINKPVLTFFLTLLLILIMIVPAAAANNQQGGNEWSGFRALRGAEVATFHLPEDMQLTRFEGLSSYGIQIVRYQQFVNDVPVFGGQLSAYSDANGTVMAVIGAHYPDLQAVNQISLSARQARAVVAGRPEATGERFFTTLMLDPSNERYFYVVERRSFDSRWFYWVDADSGEVVNAYNGLTDGTGVGVLGDVKDLTGLTTSSGDIFQMISSDRRQTTYDATNRNKLPGTLGTDDNDVWDRAGRTSPGQAALVDAHFYANVTDEYYLGVHGFDWINFYPQGMVSSAHLSRDYINAYWNGEQMAYGDGDGVTFLELSGDLDVVGHELSHGVTEATSNLIYQDESGALNESFSDIMGTAIEFYYGTGNWTIGEDIDILSDGIRDMSDPGADGDPSHYADLYTGSDDNGGVHTNSGIANHWFYLLVNGGQNATPTRASGTDVQGISLADAEQIAFLGFTALPANATFCNARASTIAVAGAAAANVADAWDEVGVDDALCGGGGSSGDGPVISNVASAILKSNGTFEITWTTDVPATSEVSFTCCGTYTDATLVTSHRMTFSGSRGVLYEYYVTSRDADGNATTEGPFYHQN